MVRTTPGHVLRKHIQNFVIESGRGEHQGRCRIASAGNAERWGLLEDAVDAVEFAASFLDGAEFEAGGICQARYAFAIGYGGSIAAAEDDRRDGEVEFIHELLAEEGSVDLAAAFAEETFDLPFRGKPFEGFGEIEAGAGGKEDVVHT